MIVGAGMRGCEAANYICVKRLRAKIKNWGRGEAKAFGSGALETLAVLD